MVCLAKGARVMLSSVEMGLVNDAMGTVHAICYKEGQAPPSLPVAVTVLFDHYSGHTLSDGTVPITPLRRSWSSSGSPPTATTETRLGCDHTQVTRSHTG